jgi:hypothetical protein
MPVSAHGPSRHLAPAQQLRRFGTNADVGWQAAPTGSVAIDPTRAFGLAKLAGFLALCSYAPGHCREDRPDGYQKHNFLPR